MTIQLINFNLVMGLRRGFRFFAFTAITLALLSCSSLPIEQLPSHNYSERVKFLVMHFTAIDYQDSVQALVDEGGLSAHYLIPEHNDDSYQQEALKVMQLVDESDRAWHAGRSYWQGREDINDQSIGIEIVNVPSCKYDDSNKGQKREHGANRLCIFPDYDPEQIELLIALSKQILARNPDIGPTQVIGHSDIAYKRKNDPGPRFPWYQLYKAGIGAWYDNHTVAEYWQQFNLKSPSVGLFQVAMRIYGYDVHESGILDDDTIDVISAFQMHFLPWQVNGKLDNATAATLFALVTKYMPERMPDVLDRYKKEQDTPVFNEYVLKHGQIDESYPQSQRSTRELVNDREVFKSYQGRGKLIIDNIDAQNADIVVNGEILNIAQPLQPYQRYEYSLARRTKNGVNTFKVENVLPEGSQLNITVPYPTLVDATEGYHPAFTEVDKLIQQDVADGFPGAVLLVVHQGKVIKRSAYGYARKYADGGMLLPEPVPMKEDTIFDLASNTKMFATNLALMRLVSEGKVDVNRPIKDYLPEYQGQGRESRVIKDLLTHRAGYSPEVKFHDQNNALGPAFFSQNKAKTHKLLLEKVPFETGKNQQPIYSDTDYMILGALVERVTNMDLDKYVEYELFHPLNLRSSRFNPLQKGFTKAQFAATEIMGNTRDGRVDFSNVRQYVLQGEVHDEKAFYASQGVAGHAGLFSNVDDLAVLAQLLLNGGGYDNVELIAPEVIDSFVKPEDADGTYGLGWRRASNGKRKWHFGPYASNLAYGHTGWTGTVTVVDPAYDLAIVLLTNARHSEIVQTDEDSFEFSGKQYEVGKFGSVISLVYEAVLNNN